MTNTASLNTSNKNTNNCGKIEYYLKTETNEEKKIERKKPHQKTKTIKQTNKTTTVKNMATDKQTILKQNTR